MLLKNLAILTVSLPLAACTIDKGDTDGSSSSASATDSASSASGSGGSGGGTSDDPTDTPPDSTGVDPSSGTTEPAGESTKPCIDTPTVLGLDDASVLGFSAAQLLDGKLGKRSTTLTFASEPTTLSDDLKNKQLPLEVELRFEDGEVRFIDSSENPDYDNHGNESGFPECIDRLEIEVAIDFVTAGKEFDERRAGILVATTVERAELLLELSPLQGSFDPATAYSDPDWAVTQLDLAGTWQGTSAGGSVLNELLVGGDGGFLGYGPLAGWGDAIDL